MFTGRSTVGCRCHITVWSVCAVMLGGVFLEVFFVSIFVFRCFSVYHPLRLVLFHTVNVSVFSRVLFWHCFCSLCCVLCAAAWVTVLYTVFVGVVFSCPYFFLYVLPSLRGMFHYCFEYRVALYGESVVYLVPVFGFSANVIFFKGVEHFSLSLIELCSLFRPLGRRSALR